MKINKLTITFLLAFAFIFVASEVQAQPGSFGDLPGFNDDVNDEPVPIFGHLFLAISAGVGIAIGYFKHLKK